MAPRVHLLVSPRQDRYEISRFLTSVKRPVTLEAKRHLKQRKDAETYLQRFLDIQPNGLAYFRFWQRGGGYDRNVWSDEEREEKLSYIHNNQLRRGLREAATDWNWSSAADYAELRTGQIPIVRIGNTLH